MTVLTAVPPVSVAVVIPVSARKELSLLMTGIAPPGLPQIIAVPAVHAVARKTDSATPTEVTPAVPLGVTKMNRIGTAVLFRMNWEQRSNPIPIAPAVVAVLSELSIVESPRCCSR